jgi:hypothetical protein
MSVIRVRATVLIEQHDLQSLAHVAEKKGRKEEMKEGRVSAWVQCVQVMIDRTERDYT